MDVSTGHPTLEELEVWLGGGGAELDDHVVLCDACAARLETLTEADELPPAVTEAFEADADLEPRLYAKVSDDLARREAMETFAGLFGLGIETSRYVVKDGDER